VLYSAAGIATFVILPFTGVVMMPTNNELMRLAKEGPKGEVIVSESDGATFEQVEQDELCASYLTNGWGVAGLWAALN
jgi:hypothetical protein